MKGIRCVSQSAPCIGEERISIAITAAAGRHILALSEGLKAARHDSGSHVLAAIRARRSRRRRRHKGKCTKCTQRGDPRNAGFQKLFHVGLSILVLLLAPRHANGMRGNPALFADENSKGILAPAGREVEVRSGAPYCSMIIIRMK